MQKKTYSSPEIQTITMLTEGMIAVSGEKQPENPVGGTKDGDLEDDMVLKSRQKDLDNNSIWD
jgi:hypothetical protein